EDPARDLEQRVETCRADLESMHAERERLLAALEEGQRQVEDHLRALEQLREAVREAEERAMSLRGAAGQQEERIRDARRTLDAIRALAAELDVSRATAEAELSHLAQQCADAVAMSL